MLPCFLVSMNFNPRCSMKFNERLKKLRKSKNLTQTELGNYLNYGYTAISNYETGKNQPSIADLIKIAKYFNVTVDYLLCLSDISNPYELIYKDGIEDDFINIYGELNEKSRKELHILMDWLLKKQELQMDDLPGKNLKVAQDHAKYQVKPPKKAQDSPETGDSEKNEG